MRSPDAKNNFADDVALVDAAVGLGGFFERELQGDRNL
jgi:hypothetical protein